MTKLKVLGVAVALAVAGGAWAANVRDEPIKPIQAAQVSDAGKVDLVISFCSYWLRDKQ